MREKTTLSGPGETFWGDEGEGGGGMLEFLKIAWMGIAKETDPLCHYVHWLTK